MYAVRNLNALNGVLPLSNLKSFVLEIALIVVNHQRNTYGNLGQREIRHMDIMSQLKNLTALIALKIATATH